MPELKKEIDVAFSHGRVAYEHDYRISKANNVSDELSQYNVDLENNLNGMKPEEYILLKYISNFNLVLLVRDLGLEPRSQLRRRIYCPFFLLLAF